MAITKKERERARIIRAELCEMSRDGWRRARPCDYQPLEAELRVLDDKAAAARKVKTP